MARLVALDDIGPNPFRPEATQGELRSFLEEGTLEEWLKRALVGDNVDAGIPHLQMRPNDREVQHGADFLRAAVALKEELHVFSATGPDHAALTWLWISTERFSRKEVAQVIVDEAKRWTPYVQTPEHNVTVLRRSLDAIDHCIQSLERADLLSRINDPIFECSAPVAPSDDDQVTDLDGTSEDIDSASPVPAGDHATEPMNLD